MPKALTYQCPNCHGSLEFDGPSGKLACRYCDSEFEPQQIEALYAERQADADAGAAGGEGAVGGEGAPGEGGGMPAGAGDASDEGAASGNGASADDGERRWADASAQGLDPVADYIARADWSTLPDDKLQALNCTSCGARLMTDVTTAAMSCPYCGNNAIVAGQLSGALKPDFVIPFKKTREDALAALRGHYAGKKLLPDAFADESHLEELTGVYVPFWLYSGSANASLDASARNVSVWADAKNTYTKTDHYTVHRGGTMSFQMVPVDGSAKMPDGHMDAIEPFDYSELAPFSVGYLQGFLADRYDQDMDFCEARMNKRVGATCGETLRAAIKGFAEVDAAEPCVDMRLENVSYALLPVWMLHTKWRGNDYLFAMNGQTGKLIGDLPVDAGKSVRMFLKWFVPSLVVALAVSVGIFMAM